MKYFLACIIFLNSTISAQTISDTIIWPAKYHPSKSRFYVHNEIDINAKPAVVWNILIDALQWESWYKGVKNIRFADTSQQQLQSNTVINWQTMGLKFRSTIKEFEPNRLLAWESVKKSIQGYHVWLIIPTANGCRVITDESQNGWLTFMEKTFQPNKLKRLHDVWLRELKRKVERKENGIRNIK